MTLILQANRIRKRSTNSKWPGSCRLGERCVSLSKYRKNSRGTGSHISIDTQGTSYTITNIETVTGRTTASNYGEDYDPCIPVYEDWLDGPFLRSPNTPAPEKYILTKTHCGGYCMDCGPGAYYYASEEEFLQGCLTGKKHVDGGSEIVTYASSIPKRAVHLIRNPFDNLVGRMHLYNKHNDRHDSHSHYDTSIEGLQSWCKFLDDKYAESEKSYPILQEYKHVPCHGEWYKYIQWHNMAYKAQNKLELPVHYLYYDHYSTQHEAAVDGVLEFLQESRRNDALPFLPGKTYRDIFTEKHIKAARKMTKALMKPKMWKLIKHYFD